MPARLQDQILAHLCLKFRTDFEGIQQRETLDFLPKAIKSSISHYLFYSLVDEAYLFRGVTNDLLFQLVISISYLSLQYFMSLCCTKCLYFVIEFCKVSEMKAEYFPPKEDVILQNEAPTDFYILVTGAVVSIKGATCTHYPLHLLNMAGEWGHFGSICAVSVSGKYSMQ